MAWELTGNNGINPADHFLGTTDTQPLVIRTSGSERLRVSEQGNVGIGTSAPQARLSVANGGAVVNLVSLGTDVPNINYPFEYETVGVAGTNLNLRLQSPNSIIFHTGNPPTEKVLITPDGDIQLLGADCAEEFDVVDPEEADPGTVMVLDDSGAVRISRQAYDRRVAGVVSGAGGYKPAVILNRRHVGATRRPLALMGKVYCKVDASYEAIDIGDLLTTSSTLGHAMKANDRSKAFGSIIGKALAPLSSGQALLPVLIALQ